MKPLIFYLAPMVIILAAAQSTVAGEFSRPLSPQGMLSPQLSILERTPQEILVDFMPELHFSLEQTDDGRRMLTITTDRADRVPIKIFFFHELTRTYSTWICKQYGHEALFEYPHLTTRLVMRALMAIGPLIKNKVVLDVGCGDGLILSLSGVLQAKHLMGIDNNTDIISLAQQTLTMNTTAPVDIIRADAMDMPELPAAPDIVVLSWGKDLLPAAKKILARLPTVQYLIIGGEHSSSDSGNQHLQVLRNWLLEKGDIVAAFSATHELDFSGDTEEYTYLLVALNRSTAGVGAPNTEITVDEMPALTTRDERVRHGLEISL